MKTRHATIAVVAVLLLSGSLFAQGARMDTVTLMNGKIMANVVVLKETASKVELSDDGNNKKVNQTLDQNDVKSIMYGGAPIDYTRAYNLYRVRSYDKAIAEFRKVGSGSARRWVKDYATYYTAMCYAKKSETEPGERTTAIAKLEEMLKDDSNRWRDAARYELGQIYLAASDKARALNTFNKLASGAHKVEMRLTASMGLGDILLTDAKPKDALAKYDTVVSGAKDKFPTLYTAGMVGKARAMTALARYDEVVKFLTEVLEGEKNETLCAKGRLALADCYYAEAVSLQEPKKARVKYKLALKNYLWNVVVFYNQKAEYAKSLYFASDCWSKLGDDTRAKSLRNELRTKCRSSEWAKKLK